MKNFKVYSLLFALIFFTALLSAGCGTDDQNDLNLQGDNDSSETIEQGMDGDEDTIDSTDEQEIVEPEIDVEIEGLDAETNEQELLEEELEIESETENELTENAEQTETLNENETEEMETSTEEEWDEEIQEQEQDAELVCLPGDRYCYTDKKLAECSEDGMSWQRTYCGDNAICADSRCVPLVCEPNQTICSNHLVLLCDDTGTSLSIQDECDSHSECQNGECIDLCMQVEEIFPDSLIIGTTENSQNSFNQTSKCWSGGGIEVSYPGPDTWYRIHLDEGETVTFKLTSLTRHFDPALYIFDVCDLISPQCITGSDACCAGTSEILRFTAPKEGYYWVVVDSWDESTGQFELKTTGGPTPDIDPSLTTLTNEYDDESKLLTLTATMHNGGTETIAKIDVAFYSNIDHSPNANTDIPDSLITQYNLMPGETRSVSTTIQQPSAGNYSAWAIIDPYQKTYDPNRDNNTAGPLGFSISGNFEEIQTSMPCKEDGRIQAEEAKSYYAFQCVQNQIIAIKISVPESSNLLPQLALIDTDRTTQIDMKQANDSNDLPLIITNKCTETGTYLAEVSASPNVANEHKTGTFSIEIASIQSFYAFPSRVKLYPGKRINAKTMATWYNEILPEGEISQDMFNWISLTPSIVTIGNAGELIAEGSVDEGFGTVAITSGGDLEPSYIFVEISKQIPGNIYQSTNDFPMAIPDEGQIRTTAYVNNSNRIQQIFVGVSITHQHTQDLKLTLRSPNGTEVVLYNGDPNQQNLLTIFGIITDVSGPGSLEDFIGEQPNGVWELFVNDKREGVVGRINSWRLYIVHEEQ